MNDKPRDGLDPHFVSLSMLAILVGERRVNREQLCEILRTQFGRFDFSLFPTAEEFAAYMGDGTTEGFAGLSALAYAALATDLDFQTISDSLERAFAGDDVRALPEYREAVRRFQACLDEFYAAKK